MAKKRSAERRDSGAKLSERVKRRAVPGGEYGVVYIESGEFAGKLGYYDDDGDRPSDAIVYPEEAPWLLGGCVVLRRSSLREATGEEKERYTAINFGELAEARAKRNLKRFDENLP